MARKQQRDFNLILQTQRDQYSE